MDINLSQIGISFALAVAKVMVCLFFVILFLQSGLDKLFNYQSELAYMKGHFAKSILAPSIPILLPVLMILELAAGSVTAIGTVFFMFTKGHDEWLAFVGIAIGGFAILAAFFGQRMAKDYNAAAGIVPYLMMTLAAMMILLYLR